MQRTFYKLHGIGNDYIYFDCFDEPIRNPKKLAQTLSDRHYSIGGDGMILIERSQKADGRMRMFNADGSEGRMCGNGVRCVGKLLYDVKGIRKNTLTVETKSGVKTLNVVEKRKGKATVFTVDMGKAILKPEKIPALFAGETVVDHPLLVDGTAYRVTCVSMGNPHCVVFGGDPDLLDLKKIGPKFEHHPAFPERVNTEFVQVLGKDQLKMRVWERGSGETWACGTGACAAAVAAVLNGYAEKEKEILVHLKGGDLKICYNGERVLMTGPAELAFVGTVEI